MKKKYYNVGLLLRFRNLKCGDPIVGGAILGGASLMSGIFQSEAQSSANEMNIALAHEQMQQQEKLFREGNRFNSLEAATARQFNAQEAQKNRVFQAGQLAQQMDWYENYNSASSQVARYLDAGLNPAALAGKTDYSSSFGIPSGAQASATPAAAAAAPSVPGARVEPVNPMQGVLKGALEGLNQYMGAKKTSAETQGIITDNQFKTAEKQLGLDLSRSEIKKNLSQVRLADADADLAMKKIDETSQIISNLQKEGEKLDVEVQMANMEKLYKSDAYKEMLGKLKAEHKLADKEADCYVKLVMSEIAKNQGAAAAAYASAEYNKALAELQPAERERIMAEKDFLTAKSKGQRVENYLNRKYGEKQRKLAILEGNQRIRVSKEEQSKLEWENSGFVRGVGIVKDVAVTAASVVGTVYGVGAIGKAASSARTATYTSTPTQ